MCEAKHIQYHMRLIQLSELLCTFCPNGTTFQYRNNTASSCTLTLPVIVFYIIQHCKMTFKNIKMHKHNNRNVAEEVCHLYTVP